MKNILYVTLAILVAFIIFEAKSLFFSTENAEYNDTIELESLGPDITNRHERFLNLIDKVGAIQAYENFKDTYRPHNFTTQHVAAHIFGEVLYDKEGVGGVAVCDNTFAFGCYHSFFLKALSEQGVEIILEMDKACIKKYGPGGVGCQHGIGHGLVEYMGPDRLVEALNACATLAWKNRLFGCQGGVFMEYTLPIIFDAENSVSTVKDINEDRPYDICPELPEKFRQACYYSLGQWWNQFFSYEKIGQLCHDVTNDKEREACYLGVGSVIAPGSNFDIAESIGQCKEMPDFEGELTCRAGASWAFFAQPGMRDVSLELCEGLEQGNEHLCAQKSDLVGERNL